MALKLRLEAEPYVLERRSSNQRGFKLQKSPSFLRNIQDHCVRSSANRRLRFRHIPGEPLQIVIMTSFTLLAPR